jgi:hypothetical protein
MLYFIQLLSEEWFELGLNCPLKNFFLLYRKASRGRDKKITCVQAVEVVVVEVGHTVCFHTTVAPTVGQRPSQSLQQHGHAPARNR